MLLAGLGCGPGRIGLGEGFGESEASDDAALDDGQDTVATTTAETTTGDGDGDGDPGDGDGDGDGDDPPLPMFCEGWVASPALDPLPADACLTRGSLPLDPAPPTGPFPPDPGEVVCGTGWGHGALIQPFVWSVEIDTTTGEQDMSLTPDEEVLVISNSFQSNGAEVLRYEASTGVLLDDFDISGTFTDATAIVAVDASRWVVSGYGDSGVDSPSIVAELVLGEASWEVMLGVSFRVANLALASNGDILATAGTQWLPTRVDRLSPAGALLWTWEGPSTATSPHITEAQDGALILTHAAGVTVLGPGGDLLDSFSVLDHRHSAAAPVGDDLLIVGNGTADDPDYTWHELARWRRSNAELMWTRTHRRALSWNGSTALYSNIYAALPHPCGGFVIAGTLPVRSHTCQSQPWIAAIDDAGEIIWADRIHACGGRPALAVASSGDVWLLTSVITGERPLLRRYSPI